MQKLLIIILSIILIYNNIGYCIQTWVQKELAQQEMEEKMSSVLPTSCLTSFELSSLKHFSWKEEGKEFWLNESLYDVVTTKVSNGKTYIYCIKDDNEEEVIERFINMTQKKSSSNEAKNVASFFAPVFIKTDKPSISPLSIQNKKQFFLTEEEILQQDKTVFSPPPETIFS